MKRKLLFFTVCLALALVVATVFLSWKTRDGSGQTQSALTVAFPNLTFNQPVGLCSPEDGTNRLFVVEQQGTIRVFENSANTATSKVFLDIADRVLFWGEQGLLGLAFHPNYRTNRYFYVNYVTDNPRRTIIARYTASAGDADQADRNSEQVILIVNQPFANHN